MGGRIGILLALTQPQLIDRLIIVDSSVVINDNTRRRWSALRQACSSLLKIEDKLKNSHGYERLAIANKVHTFRNITSEASFAYLDYSHWGKNQLFIHKLPSI